MSVRVEVIATVFRLYRGRKDRQGADELGHPLRVALHVTEAGGTQAMVEAAFLHDGVEDGLMTLQDVLNQFGSEVAQLVEALSRRTYADESYEEYIDRLARNPVAVAIKLADIADNTNEARGPIPGNLEKRYVRARQRLLSGSWPTQEHVEVGE